MPNLDANIRGFTEGDDLTIRRTINRVRSGLAAGVTITNAWLTVKTLEADADPGLFQKAITTSDVVGTGQIEDDGAGDVDPIVRFDLTESNTRLIAATLRFYDIQVKTDGGARYTGESGRIIAKEEITLVS